MGWGQGHEAGEIIQRNMGNKKREETGKGAEKG